MRNVALSFKSQGAADEAWQRISTLLEANTEAEDCDSAEGTLERAEFGNLGRVGERIRAAVVSGLRRGKMVQELLRDEAKYVKELIALFEEGERKGLVGEVTKIADIYKAIIALSDQEIVKILFCDAFYLSTFGIFECNSSVNSRWSSGTEEQSKKIHNRAGEVQQSPKHSKQRHHQTHPPKLPPLIFQRLRWHVARQYFHQRYH